MDTYFSNKPFSDIENTLSLAECANGNTCESFFASSSGNGIKSWRSNSQANILKSSLPKDFRKQYHVREARMNKTH